MCFDTQNTTSKLQCNFNSRINEPPFNFRMGSGEVEKAAKTAFLRLRPLCSAAANIPNVANFTSLLSALEEVEVRKNTF